MRPPNTKRLDPKGASGSYSARLLADLIYLSVRHESGTSFLGDLCGVIQAREKAQTTAVVQGVKGQWRVLASSEGWTSDRELPVDHFSEVLDGEKCMRSEDWIAAPMSVPVDDGRLLVQRGSQTTEPEFDALAGSVGVAWQAFRERTGAIKRVKQLETILDMTADWNQSRETELCWLR